MVSSDKQNLFSDYVKGCAVKFIPCETNKKRLPDADKRMDERIPFLSERTVCRIPIDLFRAYAKNTLPFIRQNAHRETVIQHSLRHNRSLLLKSLRPVPANAIIAQESMRCNYTGGIILGMGNRRKFEIFY